MIIRHSLIYAQVDIISGTLLDSLTNTPIAGVNITLRQGTLDSPPILYKQSDKKGAFSLEVHDIKLDSLWLGFTHLGYEKHFLLVNSLSTSVGLSINMIPREFSLNEVIVEAKRPVVQKKDTIIYDVQSFSDSTERTLEDILKKLPGVEVNNNGAISYGGQAVKKILIEGDDLSGTDYRVISQNLSFELLDEIQMLTRHVENPLLKEFDIEEFLVINITIKEDKKNTLSGSATLGLGTESTHDHLLHLLGLFSDFKTITNVSYNSIGNSPFYSLGKDFQIRNQVVSYQDVLPRASNKIKFTQRGLSVPMYFVSPNFNQALNITSRITMSPGSRVKIYMGAFHQKEDKENFLMRNRVFLLQDSSLQIKERQDLIFRRHRNLVHLKMNLFPSEKTRLDIESVFQTNMIEYENYSLFNSDSLSFSSDDNYVKWQSSIAYTKRINKKFAMYAFLQHNMNNYAQNLFSFSQFNRDVSLDGNTIEFDSISQRIETPSNYYSGSLSLLHGTSARQIQLGLGHTFSDRKARYHLQFINHSQPPNSIVSVDSFPEFNSFLFFNIKERINNFSRFFVQNSLGTIKQSIYFENIDNIFKKKYFVSSLGFLNEKSSYNWVINYTLNRNYARYFDVHSGLFVSGFRSLRRGALLILPGNSHVLNVRHHYQDVNNFLTGLKYYFNATFSTGRGNYQDEFFVTQSFNLLTRSPIKQSVHYFSISGGLDKYLPSLSLNLKIRPNSNFSTYQNQLNDSEQRHILTNTSSVELVGRTGFLGAFNFLIGVKPQFNRTWVRVTDNPFSLSNKSFSFSAYLDLIFQDVKGFSFTLQTEANQFNNQVQKSDFQFFMNAMVNYRKWKRVIPKLSIRNILNTSTYESGLINDYMILSNEIAILPRYFLFEVNFPLSFVKK